MLGFGASKAFNRKVWSILSEIGAAQLLPQMAPLNSEIEKFRLLKFSEHSAVLLLCYSSAMSAYMAGNVERAQAIYDKARDHQDQWVKMGFVDANEVYGFNTHIAENSKIKVRR